MKIKLRSMYDSFPEKYGDSDNQINFYVDNNVYYMDNVDIHEQNAIALLVEPRAIIPGTYDWMEQNYHKFRYVFTFDEEILKLPNAKLLLYGQITAEFPMKPKNKAVSMVASGKDFCEGHRNRNIIARELKGKIDTFGRFDGGEYCDDADFLQGYMFNVAMENSSNGHYFTEKICNCFASKIVPIYWGCPNIDKYFDIDGIIYCQNHADIIKAVDMVLADPEGEYNKRRDAIERNYVKVQTYRRYAIWFLQTYGDLLEEVIE